MSVCELQYGTTPFMSAAVGDMNQASLTRGPLNTIFSEPLVPSETCSIDVCRQRAVIRPCDRQGSSRGRAITTAERDKATISPHYLQTYTHTYSLAPINYRRHITPITPPLLSTHNKNTHAYAQSDRSKQMDGRMPLGITAPFMLNHATLPGHLS